MSTLGRMPDGTLRSDGGLIVTSVLFSIPDYDYLAASLAAEGAGMELGEIDRSVFPDGERYLRVLTEVNDRDVIVVGGTISDAATLDLYDLASAMIDNGAAT